MKEAIAILEGFDIQIEVDIVSSSKPINFLFMGSAMGVIVFTVTCGLYDPRYWDGHSVVCKYLLGMKTIMQAAQSIALGDACNSCIYKCRWCLDVSQA